MEEDAFAEEEAIVFLEQDPEIIWGTLDNFLVEGLTWSKIHHITNTSKGQMQYWRDCNGYTDPRNAIDNDEELDMIIGKYQYGQPETGASHIEAVLAIDGYHVPRHRVRASLKRVNPEASEYRKKTATKRRVYNVLGPHHLWHMDGNHKLSRFHLVVHAAIDGFSRACVFIHCSDNNNSSTVIHHFLPAVAEYGCPSRLRTDKGGENIRVAEYMVETRGDNRGSILAGKSTHNQRIERLWGDVRKKVLNYYISLFSFFTEQYNLQYDDIKIIFCIHYLFIPRINKDLERFRAAWNKHKLRTEHNQTPNQLLLLFDEKSGSIPQNVDEEQYGIEGENDLENEEVEQRIVEPINCPLTDVQFYIFKQKITPLAYDMKDEAFIWMKIQEAVTFYDVVIRLNNIVL